MYRLLRRRLCGQNHEMRVEQISGYFFFHLPVKILVVLYHWVVPYTFNLVSLI